MMHLTVALGFETSHRLPHLHGKCVSLHGHSWKAHVTVSTPVLNGQEIVVDFGTVKRLLRDWVAEHLDHAVMLGVDDPLVDVLPPYDTRVFVFGDSDLTQGLHYPTVENVALMLGRVASDLLFPVLPSPAHVSRVVVEETDTNTAEWTR